MRLRLENGEIVTLDDSLVGLSEFLVTIRRDAAPLASLESIIKCGPHKKSCTAFMKALTGALQKQGAAELSEDHIRQLGNPDSALCQAVCSEFGTEPELLNCLEYVHMNVDTLLNPVVHRIAFLKDPQLLLALEFLKIRCSRRGNDMFKDLPFALQGWDARKNMRTLVHSDLVPYVEFIEHLDDTALVVRARHCDEPPSHPGRRIWLKPHLSSRFTHSRF